MRQLGIIERKTNLLFLIIPLAIWVLEIASGLPGWNQAISMVGREYRVFPLAVSGAVSASYLLIKACFYIESISISWNPPRFHQAVLEFGERVGKASLKLYLIHCLDFFFSWEAIDIPLLGSTALFASIARVSFDILILFLFSML